MIHVNEIAFIGYPVAEKQRARDFYEGVLGLTPAMNMDMPEGFWIEYEIGAGTLAISNYWKPPVEAKMGPAAALEVGDFAGTIARLKSRGVVFAEEPNESSHCSMAMILDPDQNALWIHQRKPGREPYHGPEIPFVAYPVRDKQTARGFYEDLLGLKRSPGEYNSPDGFWSEYDIGSGHARPVQFLEAGGGRVDGARRGSRGRELR
ncbi:MAG: VOC family protein [Verrucomicrobiota bacterium]